MPRNLLLADDSITIQKVVGITFAGEDFSIVAVDNGEDAIRKARESRPDIILADVVMPKKNGYELCEAVKSDPELGHIPVLLLAGTFEAFDESRARAVRADGHIAKPFESQALVNKVRELLARRAPPAEQRSEVQGPALAEPPQRPAPALPRPPVPPVLTRPTPLGVAPARISTEPPSPRSISDHRPPGELDWTALGFETDAAARPVATAHATGQVPDTVAPNAAGIGTSSRMPPPPTEAAIPQAPIAVPPAQAPNASPSPELLSFGEPIDLAELEVEELEAEQEPVATPESPVGPTPQQPTPVAEAAAPADGGEASLRQALSQASREVIERIAWEVIPTLAETIIREHVERLVKQRDK